MKLQYFVESIKKNREDKYEIEYWYWDTHLEKQYSKIITSDRLLADYIYEKIRENINSNSVKFIELYFSDKG